MNASEYLSMGDAARLLGVTKARISQLAASGTLACDIVGGRKMIEYNSVVAYQKVRKRGRRPAADVGRKFTLMSADREVAHVSFDPTREFPFEIAEVLDAQRMPFGTCSSSSPTVNKRELNAWWGCLTSAPGSSRAIVNWELPVVSRCRFGAWAYRFRIVIGCGRPIATNSNGKTSITLRTNLSDRRPKSVRVGWKASVLKIRITRPRASFLNRG